MDKLKMHTPDLTDKNIDQIGLLFPNVITETRDENGAVKKAVDFDLLKQALSKTLVEDDSERYRLDWPGKKASLLKANTPINKTLRPCREESVNFDTTENLYIEGDNFEVLKILQESYLGKVKMIYIDPPYNTGNDFIYKDNFAKSKDEYEDELGITDEEGGKLFRNTDSNGRYHSDWLSMMYERLVVARDLLKDDGVIFISINDYEVHNLRKICDEVFGEDNFIDCLKWKRKKQPSFLAKHTAQVMEYIFVFGKNAQSLEKLSIEGTSDSTKKVVNLTNQYSVRIFPKGVIVKIGEKGVIKKGKYLIKSMTIEYLNDVIYEDGKTINEVRVNAQFSVSQDKINVYISEGLLFITVNKGLRRDVGQDEIGKRKSITDLLLDWGDNQDSDNEMKSLFDESYFDYTKPTKLILNLAKSNLTEDSIILDFFSGSASTAHAVMQLNADDGGNRKFIMVQLPEPCDENSEAFKAGYKTIVEIGKERIRRAGKKIVEELKSKNEQLKFDEEPVDASKLDIGFRVFKTDSTNMKDVFYHPSELTQDKLLITESNIKEDRTPEDLLTQVILDLGLELTLPIETKKILGNTLFIVQTNALVACFDNDIDFKIVDTISDLKPLKVVFKDASFKDDKDRINVEERFKRLSPETKVTVI